MFLAASIGEVEDKIFPCFWEAVAWSHSLIPKQKEVLRIAERRAASQTRAVLYTASVWYCVDRHGEHPSSCSGAGERNPLPKNSGGFQCEMHVIEANKSEAPGAEDSLPGEQLVI